VNFDHQLQVIYIFLNMLQNAINANVKYSDILEIQFQYPEVVLENNLEEKITLLKDIKNSFLILNYVKTRVHSSKIMFTNDCRAFTIQMQYVFGEQPIKKKLVSLSALHSGKV